ncbi:alpha-1,2-fucosyltransferase [bacterium C-53]|nr:alpha-1,2-fucosyltransferase [Lachnospiraceae bacterium]NBI01674.1 alpha-1,2-fucosyltransferase [Lachnospiraceae bacterium]RKJ12965.1 alpha-1,2-fucosyltransferase [bacterium C-53]
MIIVRFTSGLGNQMFQYSLYALLRDRFPETEVKADVTWFRTNSEHQGYELKRIFGRADNPLFHLDEASAVDILCVRGTIPCMISGKNAKKAENILYYPNRILRLFTEKHFEKYRIEQTGFEDNEEIYRKIETINPRKNWYITGFFIEEVYYRDRIAKLRRELLFDQGGGDAFQRMLHEIRSTNSVSIHVRRGDYLAEKYRNSFLCLSDEYYKKAVEYICERVKDPVFYVFSDDTEYVQKAFTWLSDYRVVEGNTGKDSYRDMQLMSECHHNILANSTFSVWGALLNDSEDAIVVYPKAYMREKDSEIKTIRGWVRI